MCVFHFYGHCKIYFGLFFVFCDDAKERKTNEMKLQIEQQQIGKCLSACFLGGWNKLELHMKRSRTTRDKPTKQTNIEKD